MQEALIILEQGTRHQFADWPNPDVPEVAAGVYTIWDGTSLIYCGMAGRSLTVESLLAHREDATKVTGLRVRLGSHASGRRSGDQFCIYVADRLMMPQLTSLQIAAIARRELSFDNLVRDYIRQRLSYRFAETKAGTEARDLERAVQEGALDAGKPLLNPRGRS